MHSFGRIWAHRLFLSKMQKNGNFITPCFINFYTTRPTGFEPVTYGLEIRYCGYKCCISKDLKCVFCAKMRFASGY